MTNKWVIASGNAGKIQEFQELFRRLPIQVVGQKEFAVQDVEETGLSFVENAILKARNAAEHTGLPAIADDSGLEVDALKGAPGIYSARYSRDCVAGGNVTDASNNQKLLSALSDVPEAQRTARFICALAFMRHANDPTPTLALGEWQGRILMSTQGNEGFGYDPLFYVPDQQCSAAELDRDVKNRLSHRAQAMQKLVQAMQQRGLWPALS